MSCVLLLAMADPVIYAVRKTFSTIFTIQLKSLRVNSMILFEGEHVLGAVAFFGKAIGVVHLRLLCLEAGRYWEPEEVDDVIGNFGNVV